ncbi:MAG TPA: hypothetical protein VK778_08725 [Solirubrobacteraceae bacterium]|jgi:hypothetical protein|nr:hypothetical protein [Solirubrobacteraceae bacterium]
MRKGKRTFASRKRKIAGLCAFVLAGVIGVGAYAFTASNIVPAQSAGGGSNVVSGYTEVGKSYTFSANGEETTGVELILKGEQEPHDVKVALTKAAPTLSTEWSDCPEADISKLAAKEFLAKCTFKAAIPDAEGLLLSVTAVSQGEVIIG